MGKVTGPRSKKTASLQPKTPSTKLAPLAKAKAPPAPAKTAPAAAAAKATPAQAQYPAADAAAEVQAAQDKIKGLLGQGVTFAETGASKWSADELKGILKTAEALSPADRRALASARFERVADLGPNEATGKPAQANLEFFSNQTGGALRIRIADAATKPGPYSLGSSVTESVAGLMAHEFGHAVQGGGRWDSNAIREFAKLSHWTRPDGSLVDGYNKIHQIADDDPGSKPGNVANFVSDYAKSNAVEDFAESYRVYLQDPGKLLAAAPDKFAFINAQSGKYTIGQIKAMPGGDRFDPLILAELRQSNLQKETIDKIGAQFAPETGATGTAAGDAIAEIQQRAGNPDFAAEFKKDPAKALGATWGKLAASEQRLLADPAFADQLLATAKANKVPADGITTNDANLIKGFFSDLVRNGPDVSTKAKLSDDNIFEKDPALNRFNYYKGKLEKILPGLSPGLRETIQADLGKGKNGAIYKLANSEDLKNLVGQLWGGFYVKDIPVIGKPLSWIIGNPRVFGPEKKPEVVANTARQVDQTGPAEVQAWTEMLKNGDDAAINNFAKAVREMGETSVFSMASAPPDY